jgi:hypothetical protein
MSDTCNTCRYFTPIGTEDSGLQSGWAYVIGTCTHPDPHLGGAMPHRKGIACFLSCYQRRPL